jgi:acid phosphatase type 7
MKTQQSKRRRTILCLSFTIISACSDSTTKEIGAVRSTHDERSRAARRTIRPAERRPTVVKVAAAGDIACNPRSEFFHEGHGTSVRCRARDTSDLILDGNYDAVFMLGDAQYQRARQKNFSRSYRHSWGRFKAITWAVPGNHDYIVDPSGPGDDGRIGRARQYFRYFGERAGPTRRGYYSFELGDWHVVVLNSNCALLRKGDGCGRGDRQTRWLARDLQRNRAKCTLAMWHRPRLASVHGRDADANQAFFTTFWKLLYKHKADLILNAHIHVYERFAPETPDGTRDYESGIPRFVVGTGGNGCCRGAAPKNPAHRKAYGEVLGFLELKLYPSRYTFKFKAIDDQPAERFSDSGKRMCR